MLWDDGNVANDRTGFGGGFDVSGYGSPTTQNPSRGPSRICPVMIKQLIDGPEEGVTIGNNLITMVTVVGIVKSMEVTSTRVIYTVDDCSGSITAIQWLETEGGSAQTPVVENTYCKMAGSKKRQEDKICFFIYNIVPIENMMEVTYHRLQVAYIPLKVEQLNLEQVDAPVKQQIISGDGDDKGNFGGSVFSNLNLNPQQTRVYRVLQQCNNEEGLNSKGIQSMMSVKMSLSDIDKAVDYLVSEGHIYATIDDYHFKATDLVG